MIKLLKTVNRLLYCTGKEKTVQTCVHDATYSLLPEEISIPSEMLKCLMLTNINHAKAYSAQAVTSQS